MLIFLLIVFVVTVLLLMIALTPLRVSFIFDTNKSAMYMDIRCLDPFLKIRVVKDHPRPKAAVYLFTRKILVFPVHKRKGNNTRLLRALKISDIAIQAGYCLRDPFSTGVFCGALSCIRYLLNVERFEQIPEFLAAEEYIVIRADGRVHIASTAAALLQRKRMQNKQKRRKSYGSIGIN